jgi:putative addiction module component (TIGR02574 family)
MSSAEQSLFDAALSLPEPTRAHLAEVLLASLPEEEVDAPPGDELPHAWLEEIRRRRKEIEEGKVKLLPGEEVMTRRNRRGK